MRKLIVNSQGKLLKVGTNLLAVQDGLLPSGYRELTGINFDGDSYYNTNEKLYGSDIITLQLSGTTATGQNVFGAYAGTASGIKNFSLYIYGNGSSNRSYYRYNTTLYRPTYGSGTRTLVFGATEETSGFSINVNTTIANFESTEVAYIGWLPHSTSPKYTGNILGRITAGNRLIWIPCERQSDGAIGYYELNSDTFIENSGEGTPTSLGYLN